MSVNWEYDCDFFYDDDPLAALGEFQKFLAERGSMGWELVNFQCVQFLSDADGRGGLKANAESTSNSTRVNENAYKAAVLDWKTSETFGGDFAHTFHQIHKNQIWYVFKRQVASAGATPQQATEQAEQPAEQTPRERPLSELLKIRSLDDFLPKKSQ
jgi:hypothetical protein